MCRNKVGMCMVWIHCVLLHDVSYLMGLKILPHKHRIHTACYLFRKTEYFTILSDDFYICAKSFLLLVLPVVQPLTYVYSFMSIEIWMVCKSLLTNLTFVRSFTWRKMISKVRMVSEVEYLQLIQYLWKPTCMRSRVWLEVGHLRKPLTTYVTLKGHIRFVGDLMSL